jgi:Flp pilus assembly protein protease CpaA
MLTTLAVAAGAGALLAALLYDLGWRLIPNAVPAVVAGAGLLLRTTEGREAVIHAGAVFAGVALLMLAVWRAGLLGGGDVKLAAAASLFVPPPGVATFLLATALAGGVLATSFLLARPLLPVRIRPAPRGAALPRRLARAEAWRIRRGILPYAAAIAAGAWVAQAEEVGAWG